MVLTDDAAGEGVPQGAPDEPADETPKRLQTVRHVSFDLFGTLLDYDIWGAELRYLTKLLAARKVDVNPERFLRHWLERSVKHREEGRGFVTVRESLEIAVDEALTRVGHLGEPKEWTERLLDFWRTRPLHKDAAPAIEALRGAGLGVAIVSNVDRDVLDAIAKNTGLAKLGLPTVSSGEVQAYKPSPTIYRAALRRLNAQPVELLHVGDSLRDDVEGPQKLGIKTCWVNRQRRSVRSGAPLPDIVVDDLRQIPLALGH